MTAREISLGKTLDLSAAKRLWSEFGEARGNALTLDGSAVERMGGLCLQVLLAARTAWQADGHAFDIAKPSDALQAGLALLAAGDLLTAGETP